MPWPVTLNKLKLNTLLWRPIGPFRINTQKAYLFHNRGLECKSRNLKTPGITGKFDFGVQNEAGQWLIEFCQENALARQTPSSNNTREDSTHGHHQIVNTEIRLIIFYAVKDGEALYSQQKKRPGADCGWDHELLIAKFRLKLKKVGKNH